jgi:hypothetical protein
VRRWLTVLLVVMSVVGAVTAASAQAQTPGTWQPDCGSAKAYAKQRLARMKQDHSDATIGFEVRTEHHNYCTWNNNKVVASVSVVKAMLLVAYLNLSSVRDRELTQNDRAILDPMIERSSDSAANKAFDKVGYGGLRKLAAQVGMTHFEPGYSSSDPATRWGRSRITAADQSLLMLHVDGFIKGSNPTVLAHHRAHALKLLASIVPEQRWGIAQVKTPGWDLYFKDGWGSGTGWQDHQVALLKRGPMRVSVAILTHWDLSHDYGKTNLREIAARLLRGLNEQSVVE